MVIHRPRIFNIFRANGRQIANFNGITTESSAAAIEKYVPSRTQLILLSSWLDDISVDIALAVSAVGVVDDVSPNFFLRLMTKSESLPKTFSIGTNTSTPDLKPTYIDVIETKVTHP
ncbi:MAG: hypothetical protein ACI8RD_007630 [Bacillariaceae sp.]|jgi:hypothetical protein